MSLKAVAVKGMLKLLPFDPGAMWRELPEPTRAAFRTLLELVVGANDIGAQDPPLELLEQCEAAGAEFGVPALLLAALAWEMSRYGDLEDPARRGVMGVPAELYDESVDQVRAVARVLGVWTAQLGTAAALVRYAGRERAGAVAGTMALLAVRGVSVTAANLDDVREAIALLED
jgi:hypothetical protein